MKINEDIREVAKTLEPYTPGKTASVSLVAVCRLLKIPAPEGIDSTATQFDKDCRGGGSIGKTLGIKWAEEEISSRSGDQQAVCNWLLQLTGGLGVQQFEQWTQCMRDGVWPWSRKPMSEEAKRALRDFRWGKAFPANPKAMVPLGFNFRNQGDSLASLIMDPSPMRQ